MKQNICEVSVCHRDSGRESNLPDENAILKIDGGDFDNRNRDPIHCLAIGLARYLRYLRISLRQLNIEA